MSFLPLVMLAVRWSPGVGAESGAQSLGYHSGIRVALEEGLLRWWRWWPASGGEGAPSGLLVPLLHVKKIQSVSTCVQNCLAVSAPRFEGTHEQMPHTHFGGYDDAYCLIVELNLVQDSVYRPHNNRSTRWMLISHYVRAFLGTKLIKSLVPSC